MIQKIGLYRRRLCNGEDILRVWLIYSRKKDSIFCFCCRLFSTVRISLSSSTGFSDCKHMSEHEKSVNHMRAFQLWTELHQRLRLGKTIDVENQNSNLTLKPLSQTRWESRNNAITPFRFQIGEIYDALSI
jgi:hypothetical protein